MLKLTRACAPRLFYGLAAWSIANAVLPIGAIVLAGLAIDELPHATRDGFDSTSGRPLVVLLTLSLASLGLSLLLGPTFEALAATVRSQVLHGMRERLVAAANRPTTVGHLEDPESIDDLESARGSLMTSFPAEAPAAFAAIVSTRLTGVLACLVVASYRWWLGLGLLCFWLLGRVPVRRQTARTAEAVGNETSEIRLARYFQRLLIEPPTAKEVRVYGLADWIVARYRRHFTDGVDRIWRVQNREVLWVIMLGAAMAVVYSGTYWLVAGDAASGGLSGGRLAVVLPSVAMTAMVGMVSPADFTLDFAVTGYPRLRTYERGIGGGVTEQAPDAAAPPDRSDLDGDLVIDDVSFTYPGRVAPAIDRLSLVVPRGTSLAIVGDNGAGKSTLVKLIARLYEPNAGRVGMSGFDAGGMSASAWRRRLAVVFQDFARYPLSARANIGVGAVDHLDDLDGIRDAAQRAGIGEYIEGLPESWDTVLSKEFAGAELSGGQWQRIALARSLFAVHHGATILVLDEPASWLDAYGEADFYENFLRLTSGVTSIIVSHRFSTIRRANRIAVIDHGRIIEFGDHVMLMAQDGHYATSFNLQARRFAGGVHEEEVR